MQQHMRSRFGPSKTPSLIKSFITLTSILSLLIIALRPHFPLFYHFTNPAAYLSLSLWGIKHFFLWQFFTYIFVPPINYGFSFSFFLYLGFTMYLLWVIGTSIWEIKGKKDFLGIYLGGSLFVGLFTLLVLFLSNSAFPFSGTTPAIYALLTAWIILYPDIQFLMFLIIPIKAKWIILSIAGINFLMDLSSGNFINSISTLLAISYGYFYGILIWERPGPFHALHRFDNAIIHFKQRFTRGSCGKVYDFKTGKVIDKDAAFMDKCLAKISSMGKGSLSFWERLRMRKISKKRRKK